MLLLPLKYRNRELHRVYIVGIALFVYIFGPAIKIMFFELKSISVDKHNILKFDYIDGKGNKTKRKVRLSTTNSEYGNGYINVYYFDAEGNRTFKLKRMDNINVDGVSIVTETFKKMLAHKREYQEQNSI